MSDIDLAVVKEIKETMGELRQEFKKLREDVSSIARQFQWGAWEPYQLKLPKRINQRWYWPGATVYRRQKYTPAWRGAEYQYGDEFDVLKDSA